MDSLVQLQKNIQKIYPILSDRHLLEDIVREGKLFSFTKGSIIQDYGNYVRLVPLILEGSVKVLREDDEGHELFLYFLEPGQTCSMSFSCCMFNKKSMVRTIAAEDTRLIGIPIRLMEEWMSKYPNWRHFIMQSYDNRMMEMVYTLDSIAFKQMDQRLMDYLEKKVASSGSNKIQTTHQQVAQDLNASREAISRLLKQLENQGVVELGRNMIKLN